jgi:hypothetical protein
LRYISLFSEAMDELLPPTVFDTKDSHWDTIDLLIEQQVKKQKQKEILMIEEGEKITNESPIPKVLLRRL